MSDIKSLILAIEKDIANTNELINETEKKLSSVSLLEGEGEKILQILKNHLDFQENEVKNLKKE